MPLDLDAVDWKSLTHAYGPADDVPVFLTALAEGKLSASGAFGEFSGNIWHQGTVYEASAYAVPFLIELLQSKRVSDKEWLLLLLSNLAAGSSYRAAHGNILGLEEPQVFEDGKKQENQWVQQAHEAVRQGVPVYLSLLESRRPAVRTASALVLSCFLESAREIVPQVCPYLGREKNHDVRAGLMLCLGTLSDPDPAMHRVMEEALRSGRTDPQRLAAAISLIRRDKDNAAQDAVQALQDALADPENFPEAFVFSIWDIDADPGITLYETIGLLGRKRAVGAFVELLSNMEEPIDPLVDFLLDTAFEEYRGKAITSAMLTPLQQSALMALVAADAVWGSDQKWETHSVGSLEWQYGLPTHRAEIVRLLRESNE